MERSRRPRPASVLVFAVACALAAAPARAQESAPAPPRVVTAAPITPTTPATPTPKYLPNLKEALDNLAWEPRRGPLLVIAPENVQPWRPRDESDLMHRVYRGPDPLVFAPGMLRIEQAAPHFGRKPVRCGSLTVLAPTEMVTLATRLPVKPDPYAGLDPTEKARMLQASLTAAQWRTLASEQGLGAGDLDAEQKRLFLSLLPAPFRVAKGKVMEWGGTGVDFGERAAEDPNVILTDAQRAAVRIRMNRSARFMLLGVADQRPRWESMMNSEPVGTQRWILNHRDPAQARGERYGVRLREEVPSRLKQGHIDFASPGLDAPVSLGAAKTVGDLVKAVREATRVEVYVDARAGKLPVRLLGTGEATSARSGDVLKALCWALTGAFRRVGPDGDGRHVYQLTDDIEGIGTRRARIQTFLEHGEALLNKSRSDLNKKIAAQRPLQYLTYAPNDQLAPPPAAQQKVEERWRTQRGRYEGATVEVADLSEGQRERFRTALERFQKQYQQNQQPGRSQQVFVDRVNLNVQTRMSLLVPGIGEVDAPYTAWDGASTMLPPAERSGWEDEQPAILREMRRVTAEPSVIPPSLPLGGALCVSPTTEAEAGAAVATAKKRGMRQLWIQTADPDAEESRRLLAAAIAVGKGQGVAVYAVVRLMTAGAALPARAGAADVNILGETGAAFSARVAALPERFPGMNASLAMNGGGLDWLRPDDPMTAPRLVKRLKEIAAVPGLAGIVVRDARVPGYERPDAGPEYSAIGRTASDFGYTPANRVTLIREAGYDPVDLAPGDYTGTNLILPFFRTNQAAYYDEWEQPPADARKAWNAHRYASQKALLRDVHARFRAAHPDVTLLALNNGGGFGFPVIAEWEAGGELPTVAIPGQPSPPVAAANGAKPGTPPAPPAPPKRPRMQVSVTDAMLRREEQYREFGQPKVEAGSVQAFSLIINNALRLYVAPPPALASAMTAQMGGARRPTYEGVVFDLSTLPTERALRYVEEGFAPAKAGVAEPLVDESGPTKPVGRARSGGTRAR